MRSKLFVPGSRPELFEKALASAADALAFDLEDAVAQDRKAEARASVSAFLRNRMAAQDSKLAVVRVNGVSTSLFQADVEAVVGPGLDLINIPKVESAADIRAAVDAIASAEKTSGLSRKIGLLANIENPKGLRLAAEIATADPRVVGLQIGYADLCEPLRIDRADLSAIQYIRMTTRMAAGEAGIAAYDGVFFAVDRPDLLRAEAEAARRLGFAGKTCIHPAQVSIINEVFVPRPSEIAWAQKVVEAARDAAAKGIAAFLLDGHMIDEPFINSARTLLSIASRLGLVEQQLSSSQK